MRKVWYLDITLSTPPHVRDVVEQMWEARDLGNDVYIIHWSIKNEMTYGDPVKSKALIDYMRESGIQDDELVLLRYAW